MNAQVTKAPAFAREILSNRATRGPAPTPCPAEQIGREIERAYLEKCTLQDGPDDGPAAAWGEMVNQQLEDRLGALRAQLQWTKASSLRGVYAQTCELRRMTQASALAADLDGSGFRGIERLNALIDRALRDIAGIGEFELGGLSEVLAPDDFADVLARHTGQEVREGV